MGSYFHLASSKIKMLETPSLPQAHEATGVCVSALDIARLRRWMSCSAAAAQAVAMNSGRRRDFHLGNYYN